MSTPTAAQLTVVRRELARGDQGAIFTSHAMSEIDPDKPDAPRTLTSIGTVAGLEVERSVRKGQRPPAAALYRVRGGTDGAWSDAFTLEAHATSDKAHK